MESWLVFLERVINGFKVDEETIFIDAATKEGAALMVTEYYVEDGWEVIDVIAG